MKIAFHTNQLGIRGTEVSTYSYAHYNEELLNNESIIISREAELTKFSHPLGQEKFKKRFKVLLYRDFKDLEKILEQEKVDIFYAQKSGSFDGILSTVTKTVVHCVFQNYQPHGDVYAYISKWLGDKYSSPYVPYMVDLPQVEGNLRAELNIPSSALVFGRHGGLPSFDLAFVHKVIYEILQKRDDIFFLFLNTARFIKHDRVKFLEASADEAYKVRFINSCDAMLHARKIGETFGLAVAEFSIKNKPVFTYGGPCRDSAHLQMLGDKAIKYFSEHDLFSKLYNFIPNKNSDWNMYGDYSPQNVMKIFRKVFIENKNI